MFDATDHPLLSAPAAALAPAILEAHTRLAEDLLELPSAVYDGLDATGKRHWAEAVVLQVNYQLSRPDAEVLLQEAVGGAQRSYRFTGWVAGVARRIRDRYLAGLPGIEGFQLDAFYDIVL